MRVCAQSSNCEALGKAERISKPDQQTQVGIGLAGRESGWLYGLVRTDALGRAIDPPLWILKLRGVEGRGKGDSRARPRMRLENMILDL